jgi:hypothetical protein
MKLRLKGSSLRLRLTRSELAQLQSGNRVQEEVLFPSNVALTYAIEVGRSTQPVLVAFASHQIVVSISKAQFNRWSGDDQVGIYMSLAATDSQDLEVIIEKDFACLDLSDADNEDTFANPLAGKAC